MTTQNLESNKRLIATFISEIWNGRRFDRLSDFVAEGYVQHNPNLADGRQALEGFLRGPYTTAMAGGRFTLMRLIAEADLVVAHSLFRMGEADRGTAVVDIYRVREGRIVEHWDVKEAVPEASANGNPMV